MLKVDAMVEIDTYATNELFIIDKELMDSSKFQAVKEDERYDITYLSKYNPDVWKDYNVLAPVEAIKNYK